MRSLASALPPGTVHGQDHRIHGVLLEKLVEDGDDIIRRNHGAAARELPAPLDDGTIQVEYGDGLSTPARLGRRASSRVRPA